MKDIVSKMRSHTGAEFNKSIVGAPLNKSTSKASFSFSKAKRFSNISVNDQGFAITVLKAKGQGALGQLAPGMTSAATTQPSGYMMDASAQRLNKQSDSHLNIRDDGEIDDDGDYGDDYNNEEYDDANADLNDGTQTPNRAGGLSQVSSIERINAGGRNRKPINTEM